MTEVERKLLIWCAGMLVRGHSLDASEIEEVKGLIAELLAETPHDELPSMTSLSDPVA
jgi:hypothetical protein